MIIVTLAFFICVFQVVASIGNRHKDFFLKSVDDVFNEAIGDIYKVKQQFESRRKIIANNITELQNIMKENTDLLQQEISTTTTIKSIIVTPLPNYENLPRNMEQIKLRMKKIEINKMLKWHYNPIPDFKHGQDDPHLLTRRFGIVENAIDNQQGRYQSEGKLMLREQYHLNDNHTLAYRTKIRTIDTMLQFIYMATYKMGVLTELRTKYLTNLKYQVGYCFALLRLVRTQQKIMYNTLKVNHKLMKDAMIPMELYFKIVKLNVDIKDIVKLIFQLNYKLKVQSDPNYYEEPYELPPHMRAT